MDESLTGRIRGARPPKLTRRAGESMGWAREYEPDGEGGLISSRTYFLVGSECRFSCSMCDLWKYTLTQPLTPIGSLTKQIQGLHLQADQQAIAESPREWLKLYNASNFFDSANVDPQEYISIAKECAGFDRVVVENHAAMLASQKIKDQVRRFRDLLEGDLELAMGLETIDPEGMRWLNKAMTLDQFSRAVEFLCSEGIYVRAFVLLQPLGTPRSESVEWAIRSCRQASQWGVDRVSLIPTRAGSGFIEQVSGQLCWEAPEAWKLEKAFESLLKDRMQSGEQGPSDSIYTVDLWDWGSIPGTCSQCSSIRYERLQQMNHVQQVVSGGLDAECSCCRGPGSQVQG